jgi:serine/threonine-protein kinase
MRPRPAPPGGPSATQATTVDLAGASVGGSYLLVEPIGGGATGRVWRAVDRDSGDQVAVKLLRADLMTEPKAVTRFVRERAILLMLRHPNIVRVRDLLAMEGSLGLVMDLVPGGSLREHLRRDGTLAPAVAAGILAQVAAALAEAHGLGVVHRDLKPDNVLLDPADGQPHVWLTDFGIARLLDSPGLTTPQALVGTPNYLAPEIITGGDPTPAADVYAMGVLLYELLLGRPPYAGGPPVAVLRRHLECRPRRHPGVPDHLWRAVLACMAPDPAQRPTAGAMAETMRLLVDRTADRPAAAPAPAADEGSDQRSRRGPLGGRRWWPWRHRWLALLLAGVAAVSVTAASGGLPGWLTATERGRPRGGPAAAAPAVEPGGPTPALTATATGPADPATASGAGHEPESAVRRAVALPSLSVAAEASVAVYGPLRCTEAYVWDVGHPVLAMPCHATGPAIRLVGRMQAMPGVQADVSLSLHDADIGRLVAGPYTCAGLVFTDFKPAHRCGPFDVQAERGHRYTVVQKWAYTGRGLLPSGTARSDPFAW